MQTNRVKKILRDGGLALGTYTGGIADPQIVEIIGHAGYDAAFIDMEHTSFDLRDIQLMFMAAERLGITPVGPSDMSRTLRAGRPSNHPKLVEVGLGVAHAVRKGGIARLALPMN